MNEGEVETPLAHEKGLVGSGFDSSDIGIIMPYATQVGNLKTMRSKEMNLKDSEISIVDENDHDLVLHSGLKSIEAYLIFKLKALL